MTEELPNGPAAAAILAAAIGCAAIGGLGMLGDGSKSVAGALTWYAPSGPLSGETTCAVGIWLLVWAALAFRWGRRSVDLRAVSLVAAGFVVFAFLSTFPPVADRLLGK